MSVETSNGSKSTMKLPIRMVSRVVHGFGRGSTDLGIPTANLDRDNTKLSCSTTIEQLPTGIYWGFGRIGGGNNNDDNDDTNNNNSNSTICYKTACSIGYNPTYGNTIKTVEPHFIALPDDNRRHASSCGESLLEEFYNQPIRLSVVGYLRPELPFEGIDKLIQAIKQDIVQAEEYGDGTDPITLQEKAWVASNEDV